MMWTPDIQQIRTNRCLHTPVHHVACSFRKLFLALAFRHFSLVRVWLVILERTLKLYLFEFLLHFLLIWLVASSLNLVIFF